MWYHLVASSLRLRGRLNKWFCAVLLGGVKLPAEFPVKWPPQVNCGKLAGCICNGCDQTMYSIINNRHRSGAPEAFWAKKKPRVCFHLTIRPRTMKTRASLHDHFLLWQLHQAIHGVRISGRSFKLIEEYDAALFTAFHGLVLHLRVQILSQSNQPL